MKYPRIYKAMRDSGHSAAKAMEIILDATRGSQWARSWIGTITRIHRGQV